MDKLFEGCSITDRGTLAHIKNAYGHRSATTTVMKSFNHSENLIRHSTESHVVYAAMHLTGMQSIDDIPANSVPNGTREERKEYLHNIAKQVVSMVWLLPSIDHINQVVEADLHDVKTRWCFCNSGIISSLLHDITWRAAMTLQTRILWL